jgi:hypothetical protein
MTTNEVFEARLLDLYVGTIRAMDKTERDELLDDLLYRREGMVTLMTHVMAVIRDPDHAPQEQRSQDLAALEAEANSIIDHILKTFRST